MVPGLGGQMKFVMTKPEVAEALSLSADEFDQRRNELEQLGFPLPVSGLGERWSIIDVINWVNRKQAARAAAAEQAGARPPLTH